MQAKKLLSSHQIFRYAVPARTVTKKALPPSNLQPIATRGKKARGTLLVDIGCSSKCAPPPLVITTKLAAAILVVAVVSS